MKASCDVAGRLKGTSSSLAKSLAVISAVIGISIISGCGGGSSSSGGSGSNPTGPTGPTTQAEAATAVFTVDVKTGRVTVTKLAAPGANNLHSSAIVSGSAVGFNSSVLLDQAGSADTGLKTINVSMTNNFGLPLGVNQDGSAQGLRVIFSAFTAQTVPSDIRPLTTVSTAAGTGALGTGDGAVGAATFNAPAGVATTGTIVYTTDFNAGSLRKISAGTVSTLTTALVHPYGCAVNPVDGAIIVADPGSNKVMRVTSGGSISVLAGTGTAGEANGVGNVATFNGPTGVAVDSSGNIYVSDAAGNRIRSIRFLGGAATTAANYFVSNLSGTGAAGAADGLATAATFNSPAGLALDTSGHLYVADTLNNTIRSVDPSGNVTTIAGTGTAAEIDGRGDGAAFDTPRGIAFVNGALIVSDSSGETIRQIIPLGTGSLTSTTAWVQTIGGTPGVTGASNGNGSVATFTTPQLIGVDPVGSIFIPDMGTRRVRKIAPTSGSFPLGVPSAPAPTNAVVLSNPTGGIPNSGAGSNLPYIAYPSSIDAGATSSALPWNFVIAPGVTSFQFTVTVEASTSILTGPTSGSGQGAVDSQVRTLAGKAQSFGFVDGVASAARFGSFIQGLGTDSAGDVFIADFHDNSIRRITPDGTVNVIAGTLATGGGSAVDGSGAVARFNGPSAIAVTPDGQIVYVGDANNNKIRRIALTPGADPKDPTNWNVSTIAGSGTQSTADGPGNTASLVLPEGVALDPTGNIYVSEDAGNRIKRVTFQGGDPTLSTNYQVRTVAGDTSTTFPAVNWVDGTGTAARFADPVEIACDVQGNVYIADSFNNRIRKMDPGGVVTTVAGSGTSGYVDGNGAAAQFSQPNGLAIDSAGYLYVADTSSEHIRRISPAGIVTTVAGTGGAGSFDGSGNVATFTSPFGLTVNRTGDVIVGGTDGAIRLIQRVIAP